ncbi:Fc.00g116420.m01.CDS01 [Cosmosporella sp. VM-42]
MVRDNDSITASSMSVDGTATPTDTEGLGHPSAIDEWLRSSQMNGETQSFGAIRVTRNSDPRAGDTFLIVDQSQNRALACYGGHLRLEDATNLNSEDPVSGHWQWFCTEKDGFKGFQNVAEGGFLGHDIWWDFYAKVPHHKGWESFILRRHEGGCYWIQSLYWWELWQMSARSDGQGVYVQKDGGMLWEFIKVHKVCMCQG